MRAKKWICRGLVMPLILLMAIPCAASGEAKAIDTPDGATSDLSNATLLDSGSVNTIGLGEVVYILVTENQTTPYRWEYVISDETVMQDLYDEYTSDFNPLGKVGVGGKHRFYFIAANTGACSIDMRLLPIGADKEEASQEVTYTVMVEEHAAEEGDDGNYMYTDQANFCGYWHASPFLSSSASSISGAAPGGTCYDARYLLDVDGTFIYGCDETDGLDRVRYAAGNWYIEGNRLYLETWERIVWEGGREVAASGSIRTERMIENPTVRLIGYDEPELEAHDIMGPLSPAELGGLETAGRKAIKIGGQVFYSFDNDTSLLDGFWEMKK
jgi:predicted secreted protein